MKFGLFSMNSDSCAEPGGAALIARRAEEAGFESLWAGEHVVLPDPQVPPSPMAPADPILDPLIMLSFLAAHTKTIQLGTGIIILPQRQPLVLAKQLASLNTLAPGRFYFGMGVGYLRPEMEAIGVNFEERGAIVEEYLGAMQAIWTEEKPSYQGKYVKFSGVQAYPKARIKIVMGGHTRSAYHRAVKYAVGWYGFALNLESTAQAVSELKAAKESIERPAELGELEISVTPRGRMSHETIARFAELGVDRLILMPRPHLSLNELEKFVMETGQEFIR